MSPYHITILRWDISCFLGVFLRYTGLSLLWPLPLRSTVSGRAGSVAMAHGPSRSTACGIFPDRGTNPCPLHRQADCQPLRHQGSPNSFFLIEVQLIYNIVIVSGVQHSDSVFLQIIFHQSLLQGNGYTSLYSKSLLFIYFIYSSLYLLIAYP